MPPTLKSTLYLSYSSHLPIIEINLLPTHLATEANLANEARFPHAAQNIT
jgi:hypothetical protein